MTRLTKRIRVHRPRSAQDLVSGCAAVAGRVLAAISTSLRVLPRTKPLHPRGVLYAGRLEVFGLPAATGAPLLDGGPAARDCLVRISAAVGLPQPWPDITGVAVRVEGADGGDLLFASTGTGRWTRFLLLPRIDRCTGSLTTLLPFRTRLGLTWLALSPGGRSSYRLLCATHGSAWAPLGTLRIGDRIGTGDELRFGPVEAAPAGLTVPRLLALLRQPAYARARGARINGGHDSDRVD